MQYILQHYQQSFHFYKHKLLKPTILMAIIFFGTVIASALLLSYYPNIVRTLLTSFQDMVDSSGIVSDNGNISSIALMLNNMKACFVSIAIGIVPFLFLPMFSLCMNAALIGAIFTLYSTAEIPVAFLFAGLIPHGIFEIPALIMSMALGVYLCKELTMKLFGKRVDSKTVDLFGSIINFYICIIIPLLIIAGIVEAYITPLVMDMIM